MPDPLDDREAFLALSEAERREVIAEERRARRRVKRRPDEPTMWVPAHPRNKVITYATPRARVVPGGLPTLGKRR